jgi:hypothetical protein
MADDKKFMVLCFEDSYAGVVTFPTEIERTAYAAGVVEGATHYGAGAIGTYNWPEEFALLKKEAPAAHKAAIEALARGEAKEHVEEEGLIT